MNYLGAEYRLQEISPEVYEYHAKRAAQLQIDKKLGGMLRSIATDYPELPDSIHKYSYVLQCRYRHGGGLYSLAAAAGISALREVNPIPEVPLLSPKDWEKTVERTNRLGERPGVDLLESLSGIALLEIYGCNPGYIDGYQETMDKPGLTRFLGFSGLGTVHAHDLMHFASIRG